MCYGLLLERVDSVTDKRPSFVRKSKTVAIYGRGRVRGGGVVRTANRDGVPLLVGSAEYGHFTGPLNIQAYILRVAILRNGRSQEEVTHPSRKGAFASHRLVNRYYRRFQRLHYMNKK